MKKVWFFFDYGTWPVWYQDENMDYRESGLPLCVADNQELDTLMREIENEYEGLFIDNSYEFTFVGFKDEESWLKFKTKVDGFIELLKKAVEPEYEVDISHWNRDCIRLTLLDGEEV